ncbi:sporulation histidine kinase inhibitor Sda [Paenibacillaceae bacterium WGS1546]|uniref:sporulation histidine kinase inhibitor Sda n=1 Tax=Cohnella sp. WGS1546 TaxID=3366810 RepID=UPI00372D1E16
MMHDRSYPHLVTMPPEDNSNARKPNSAPVDMVAARRLSDKASLLRPLKDEHLLEVYREAKKMNLSDEFIELLEEALSIRQLSQYKEA